MVTELLSVDKDLIRVKGREGFIVLHFVALQGNVDLLSRFLDLCPECVFDLSTRKQTALHIAAEYNSFEAFEAMVEWIQRKLVNTKRVLKSKILNSQDKDGNTALHLAAANNQQQMIKLLMSCKETDKNKSNEGGLTASDVLQRQTEDDDNEMLGILKSHPGISQRNKSWFDTQWCRITSER
ncbi:ankyrin repeat-containing protein BDA1-like [Hibiscus syriacus]|uniref:ankyrin repeat-containing protein BDA1-like n=1 Tax=Hibiscus syriacus TaxID=106335 RepID=UPI00192466FB|nr:ankyrin repeat-containing protein BDA1-like [Hibiscus syriacus]